MGPGHSHKTKQVTIQLKQVGVSVRCGFYAPLINLQKSINQSINQSINK
jgi:hypothetical protein